MVDGGLRERTVKLGTEFLNSILGACAQAYAAARFAESVLRGLEGEPDVYEAAYVESKVTELPYFASKVRSAPPGVQH